MRQDIEKIIREYIDKSLHMSLGTSQDNKPWVCEVHFVFDDQLNLYFRSLKSRRHSQEIAANPNVAGNIVAQHLVGEKAHGVYFEGTAAIIEDDNKRQKLFPLFKSRLGTDESILEGARTAEGHQFYMVTVENWYAFGDFGDGSVTKYQLVWNGGAA
jgi:uncharacterized protein YhbP (UPF0306 family)